MHADKSQNSAQPTEIVQVGQAALRVDWADGHASEYPFPILRRHCRCAGCQEEEAPPPASANPFRVLGPEPSSAPASLEQVGNYGLGVHWSDGHYSIYAFDALRAECPCPACHTGRAATRATPQA